MPFLPNEPQNGEVVDADLLRAQLNALNDQDTGLAALIANLTARVTALETPPATRRGLIFNGLDNYAVNPAVAWPATGTWELWIKVTGTISDLWPGVAGDSSGLPGTNFSTGLPGFEFYGAGDLLLQVGGGYVEWHNTVDWSQWHHLAITWDAAGSPQARLFVDGAPMAERPTLDVPVTSPAPLQLGYPTRTNAGLQMAMSEVRLSSAVRYNASFTPAQTFAPDADTVALYKFTEQTGLTVADSSVHANALTFTALPGGTLPVWFVE